MELEYQFVLKTLLLPPPSPPKKTTCTYSGSEW